MREYQTRAYAKINLCLDVTGRLENGYHLVKMIMQTVGICDELRFEKAAGGVTLRTDSPELPTDDNNLICRAVRMMQEQYGITDGVKVTLHKQIPIAAGMAGGSTDAAAALRAMNELFALGLPKEKLMELGVKLGADVPYCVLGGTALAEGIGEKLTPLQTPPDCFLLVAKPDINVSTKAVYEELDAGEICDHPDVDGMLEAIGKGSLEGVTKRLGNVLETVTTAHYPVINEIKQEMRSLGAKGALMSGSGPTVFGIFEREGAVRMAYEEMQKAGLARQLFVTTFAGEA